jgi:nicotinamidase-related amidase
LAVAGGRDIVPIINGLLASPKFDVRVATRDWHPADHISFAANHPEPDNRPFESFVTIANPYNPSESYETRLWPVHCVQDTPGAQFVPDLETTRLDRVFDKGQDKRVEMYSAFGDLFENPRVAQSGLQEYLKGKGVGKVFVVGLALDYCIKATAEHAVMEGFATFVVEDAIKAIDPGVWTSAKAEMEGKGIRFVASQDLKLP